MKRLLIVDGYNLINIGERYKEAKEDGDLEGSRVRLIEDLAAFATLTDVDIIAVFDAAGTGRNEQHKARILGIEVWFTRGGESADSVIERLAYDLSSEREIVVATSDYAQQKAVSRRGVSIKSARQLALEMLHALNEAKKTFEDVNRSGGRVRLEDRIDAAVKATLDKMIRG